MINMNEKEWIDNRLPTFRVVYPEKTDNQIIQILKRGYNKFASVVEGMANKKE